MKSAAFLLFLGAAACAQEVAFVAKLPAESRNAHYAGNRAPLLASPLVRLPIGSVRPEGWLRKQLELEAAGFSGRLTEISKFCKFEGNAWTHSGGQGQAGWEEVPYWLKGFTDLGYVLKDDRIVAQARQWLEAVLETQREDGYFGSQANLKVKWERGEMIDLWPNMAMLYPLRTYYDATGDRRILDFMLRYFRWQATIPMGEFLPGSWQKFRAGDNLDSIYWLYNRTGEKLLLDLGRMNHVRTADWSETIPTWHGVNIAQCFREPAQYYQQARDLRFLNATVRDYDTVMGTYGQVPGGMFGADENAREGYTGPRQGAETCAMAEMMYSHEMLAAITGDALWADRAEDVAFNSFPASMTPDLKGLHYLTAPNQPQLDRRKKAPVIENDGDMFSYNPYQYRCCQHNAAFGWPYFAEHLWMATAGNGLAATLYAASTVTAKVADGDEVTIAEETSYPFDEAIAFTVTASKPVRFPLVLRVPGWAAEPKLALNGESVKLPKTARGWLRIDREWQSGDRVRLELPMQIRLRKWEQQRNAVSVDRGPLTYSLEIGERWDRYNKDPQWAAFEVFPTTPWNYGLVADAPLEVVQKAGPMAAQPFTPEAAPIAIKAKAKRIRSWKLEGNGMIGQLPASPVKSNENVEEVTLIPMGAARLRVSVFPTVN